MTCAGWKRLTVQLNFPSLQPYQASSEAFPIPLEGYHWPKLRQVSEVPMGSGPGSGESRCRLVVVTFRYRSTMILVLVDRWFQ